MKKINWIWMFVLMFQILTLLKFKMREEQSCTAVRRVTLDAESAKNFREKIDDEYRVNIILDNFLLLFLDRGEMEAHQQVISMVFWLGSKEIGSEEKRYFINNHLSFRVMYHLDPETDATQIVGFEVAPNSCAVRITTGGGDHT